MEERFAASYVLDRTTTRAYAALNAKRPLERVCIAVILVCAVLLTLLGVLLLLLLPDGAAGNRASGVRALAFGVPLIAYAFVRIPLQGRLILAGFPAAVRGKPLSYAFADDQFTATTPLSAEALRYAVIAEIRESDTLFALHISRGRAFLIPKSAFTRGTPEAFIAFLRARTDAKYRCFVRGGAMHSA